MRDDAREKKSLDLLNAFSLLLRFFFGVRNSGQLNFSPLHTLRANSDLDKSDRRRCAIRETLDSSDFRDRCAFVESLKAKLELHDCSTVPIESVPILDPGV